MSDERDGAGSAGDGTVTDSVTDSTGDTRGQTAVVTRPARPTGKRSRRGAVDEDASDAVDLATGTEASSHQERLGRRNVRPPRRPPTGRRATRSPSSGTT